MKRLFVFTGITTLLVALLASCNLPTSSTKLSLEEQAGTLVAQTLEASETEIPAETPTLANTPTKSLPTVTITPTYSLPVLSINENTNCRSGPGEDYEIVTTYISGAKAEIVGKHAKSNYWVVKNHNGQGTCWIWGEYTTASGSHWTVPTMTPPPTKTPSPPAAPSLQDYNFFCAWNGSNNDLSITIKWTDKANNETGYRIYRDGAVIVDLGANTTAYTDIFAVDGGQTVSYAVVAYNTSGSAGLATISAACQ